MTKKETARHKQNLRLKRKTKCIVIGLISMMVMGIASAAYLHYFGNVTTTVTTDQSVLLDGMDFHEMPIEHEFDVVAGCEECFDHWLFNQGCQTAWVNASTTGIPDMDGIDVTFYTNTTNELVFPIWIEPGEQINFTICYEFDIYLEGNTYEITTLFTTPYY